MKRRRLVIWACVSGMGCSSRAIILSILSGENAIANLTGKPAIIGVNQATQGKRYKD
jgi:hypothetical protein